MANYDRKKLLHYINVVSFAVDEAKLFLDTHPCDKEAMEYLDTYNQARNQALMEYGKYFGPLTIGEASCGSNFKWATEAWPWEMEG